MTTEQIFLAVKRAPVQYRVDTQTNEVSAVLSAGGTANVVAEQAGLMDLTLVASAASEDDHRAAELHPNGLEVEFTLGEPVKMHLIRHTPKVFESVQYAFQSELLWALNNLGWDTWTTPTFDASTQEAWAHFTTFTEDFARELLHRSDATDRPIFLLHDYQMICLPRLLREQRPSAAILLFIHVPWPSTDYWRILPRYMRTTILERMLSADVIGFFASRWARNFLACVDELVEGASVDHAASTVTYGANTSRVEVMPLGYSADALSARKRELSPELAAWAENSPLVVHSGRTDPMKNGVRAVQAFVLALQQNPELADTKLLMRTNPNRLYINANQRYMDELQSAVKEANAEFGDEKVSLICENDVDGTMASYERADVLFFNSTIDGQNLSVYEGTLVNGRSAPVVLSETCGAAETLGDVCTIINPFDIQEQADALRDALMLETTQREADASRRREVAEQYSLRAWIDQQLACIRDREV